MSKVKEKMADVINALPEDASYDDILRELAFARMVDRGLDDARSGRTIPAEEMKQRMESWRK